MDREYVIVSMKHMKNGYFLFWGHYTKDDESRSYGGYTMDLDHCEKYSLFECLNDHYHFPFYDSSMHIWTTENFYIKVDELHNLGKKMTVIYDA
jgi:hypothetical protein